MFVAAMRTWIVVLDEGVSTGMDTDVVNLHGSAGLVLFVELRIDILLHASKDSVALAVKNLLVDNVHLLKFWH